MNGKYGLIQLVLVLLMVSGFVACEPKGPPTIADLQQEDAPKAAKRDIDIGDVEFYLKLEATLPPGFSSPNISENQMRNKRDWLDLTTITVESPAPEKLDIRFALRGNNFPGDVIVARFNILREQEIIGTCQTVITGESKSPFIEQTVDVFAGLTQLPDTLLIHARGELVLMPKGTDPASIDPKTATGSADNTGAILSNPVRINIGMDK